MLRLPPRVKILEALGAVADGRVVELGERLYRVASSEGDRWYLVYVDPEQRLAYSDDNGTRYRGYIGYPIIAVLMLQGRLPFDERIARALRGVPWRRLNERYQRYALVEQQARRLAAERGVEPSELDGLVSRVLKALRGLELRYTGSPPLVSPGGGHSAGKG